MIAKLLTPFLGLMLAAPSVAQSFDFGIKAGVPVTAFFETGVSGSLHGGASYSFATRRYTLGPSVDWRMSGALGCIGYAGTASTFSNGYFSDSTISVSGSSWDFPLMLKYRFGRVVRPYVAGGGVFRYIGPVRGRGEQINGDLLGGPTTTQPLDTTDPSDLAKRFYPGVTAAGGVELGTGRLRFLPEFRYTRWTANISGPGGLLRISPNQVEFLLGISTSAVRR